MERELIINLGLNRTQAEQQARQFADGERERIRRHLTDFEVAERAKAQIIDRSNSRRIAAEVRATEASKQSWGITDQAVQSAAKAVGSFAVQMVGLNSIQSVLGTISENFQKANREAMEAAKFVQGYRAALLELAALKGQMGNTTQTLSQDLAFRAKTLQTAPDARAFQLAALGAGESAIGINISAKEAERARELGGKFQATEGSSASTHGTLIGMIPTLMGGKGITGEQAFAKEQQLFRIAQPGGAEFGSMIDQFLQQAPLVTGGIYKDPADMMAVLSAFSTTNKGGAGTNVGQFTRATVGGLGRMRGAQIEGLVEKQGQYLSGLGADNQMDPTQIGKLISKDFSNQEQLEKAKGRDFNAMDYLKTHGYANQDDILALIGFHGMMKSGQFEGTFEKRAGELPTTAEALAPIEARMAVDPVFQGRRADISEEAAKVVKGAGKEEMLNSILRPAFSRLQGRGEVVGEFDSVMNPTMGQFSPTEFMFGYKQKTEMEAQGRLAAEAERLGIDPKTPFRVDARTGARTEEFMGRDKLFELSQQIQAKGGDVQGGFQEDVASAVKKLDNVATNLERAAANLDKAAAPKSPPIQAKPVVQTR